MRELSVQYTSHFSTIIVLYYYSISKTENCDSVTQMNQRQKITWEITCYSGSYTSLHWCNVSLIAISVFQIPIWLWPFTALFHSVVVQSHRERTRSVCPSHILPDISNMQTTSIFAYDGTGGQGSIVLNGKIPHFPLSMLLVSFRFCKASGNIKYCFNKGYFHSPAETLIYGSALYMFVLKKMFSII